MKIFKDEIQPKGKGKAGNADKTTSDIRKREKEQVKPKGTEPVKTPKQVEKELSDRRKGKTK